ncbi:TPA: hypothetical protein P2I16_004523 [Aeromonas salmonicida]|nr:hypothetical protein [Aeromonas salmonicida]HDN9022407.1 hypothetical protein [Aeromonas salmonicida]
MQDKLESMLQDTIELNYLARKLTETDVPADLGTAENMMVRKTKRLEKKLLRLIQSLKGSDGK